MRYLSVSIKFTLFLVALTPLVVTWDTLFPYIFGKMVYSRTIIELAAMLCVAYIVLGGEAAVSKQQGKQLLKNPLIWFILLFFISLLVSTFTAENVYRAFWGDAERAEGVFGMLHIFAFLVMTIWIFSKQDWIRFFKFSLIIGGIVGFYALLQYFEIEHFPFAFTPEARPGSFLGNPAIFASYMFFIMIFAGIVGVAESNNTKKKSSKIWKYSIYGIVALALITIFFSGTRGAILGLGAGILVLVTLFALYKKRIEVAYKNRQISIPIRLVAVSVILGGVIMVSAFWATRDHEVWQNIPGFSRLAQTSLEDESTIMRLLGWGVSWDAFLERPIVGWGPENYLFAYEKHYNPDMSRIGETWLDRAHNKLLDVAVMRGSIGIVAYLGMFIALGALLARRMKQSNVSGKEKYFFEYAIISAGTTAYFVQNLVLFDQINSYLPFFALIGYLVYKNMQQEDDEKGFSVPVPKKVAFGIIGIILISISFVWYRYNMIPYVQAITFREAAKGGRHVDDLIPILKKALYPYTFVQLNLRGQGVDAWFLDSFFYNDDLIYNPGLRKLADLFLEAEEELVRREPYDVRVLIRLAEMINPLAERDIELYKETEKLMRIAVERAPKRQEVYYHLAFSLAGQERFEESIETARYALSLSPEVARAHYHLALMLMVAGQYEEAEREMLIAEELRPDLRTLLPGDKNNVIIIYDTVGRPDKSAELVLKSINGTVGANSFSREYYENTLRYFALRHEAEEFLSVAQYLKKFDDLEDDMEVLINLVENERWDIIDALE